MGYARKRTQGSSSQANTQAASRQSQSTSKKSSGSIWQMEIGGGSKKTVMKRLEVLLFTSELADLIEAGMTLGQALQALANQGEENSAQRYVCQDICDRIVRGETFSSACSHHPKTFEPLYVNMIAAAEAAGAMVDVLRRLADHYERSDSMRGKIKSALSYPVIVLIFGVFAVVAALVWIIPKFEKVFSSMGATLPLPTRILIGMSNALINWGWLIAIIAVVLGVLFVKWKNSPSGRYKVDGWKLRAPLIKGIVACGLYSSLAYTLKTLLMNGVNVLQALKIAEETCSNAVIAKALNTARMRVTDGTSISGPLAASGVFPRMMTDMLAIGEQAGDMIGSLEHIGSRYQKEMDRNIASFTNALEPILIVAIAIVVGFIAISILTAVFEVSATLG
ncbi:MAG: type II secretion system F family protein [Kiritimatiellae bacterium]|nr:type II secretion system F family protein [Kiritimatiellia bacterium]MBR3777442.1 type II secretion system F family protein [Kiritimatiellia bacterium]